MLTPLAGKCEKSDILHLRAAAQYINIQKSKIPHHLRTRYSFKQVKPIKASHTRPALEGSRGRKVWNDPTHPDVPHVHAVQNTQQPRAVTKRQQTPFVHNIHVPQSKITGLHCHVHIYKHFHMTTACLFPFGFNY